MLLHCKWGVKRLDTSSPLAAFNEEVAEWSNAAACKAVDRVSP